MTAFTLRKVSESIFITSIILLFTINAYALEKVRTYSIPFFSGFSVYVAEQEGFFEKHGIETKAKWFPSGAPIIQAAASFQWDMTFLGAPPAVLGGPAMGLKTVGMVYEERAIHELIGRPDFVAAVKKNKNKLKGAKIFVTTLSTGHFMTESCLQHLGVSQSDITIIPSEQASTVSAFSAGEGDLAQAWPPATNALRARGNKTLCDAKMAGLSIPSVWVAHPKFAKKNPDLVEKWLKANLEAIAWIKKDPKRTFELYKKYDKYRGFETSEGVLREEAILAATALSASEQVKLLSSQNGKKPSIVSSYEEIAKFYMRVGRLKKVPDYSGLVDGSYMKKLAN